MENGEPAPHGRGQLFTDKYGNITFFSWDTLGAGIIFLFSTMAALSLGAHT
jgi:hypothetical protein